MAGGNARRRNAGTARSLRRQNRQLKSQVRNREVTERALQASESRFRTLFQASPDGIMLSRLSDGVILETNHSFLAISGYSSGELAGRSVLDADLRFWNHPADRARLVEDVKALGRGTLESVFRIKDGTLATGILSSVLMDVDGQPCLLTSIRDVTDQRRTEAVLKEREQNLRSIFEGAPIGMYRTTLDGRLLQANGALASMFGYGSPEEMRKATRHLGTAVLWESPRQRQAFLEKVVAAKGHHYGEAVQLLRRDGRPLHAYFNMMYSVDQASGHPFLVGFVQDITELKEAEDQLRFRNLLLTTQQEASPDGILVIGDKGEIISFNGKFQEMWEVPPEVLASRSDDQALQAVLDQLSDPEAFLERVRYLYRHPFESSFDELRLVDGRLLERFSAPMLTSDHQCQGRIWYFRDITDRRRTEIAVLDQERLLREMFEGSPIGIFRSTPEGRFTQVNPALAHMFHYESPSAMVERVNRLGIAEAMYETPGQRQDLVRRLQDHPGGWHVEEIHFRRGDGTFLDGIMSILLNPDPATRLPVLFGFVQDISERKNAELALLESRANLAALIESTHDFVWSVDLDHRLLIFNSALREHVKGRYGTRIRVGAPLGDFLPGETRGLWSELYGRAIESGPHVTEYRLPGDRTIEMAFHPILRDRRPIGVSVFGKDITERKRSEEEIRSLKGYLANIIDSMPSMLVGLDPEGAITQWNRQAEAVTGIPAREALGRPMARVLPEFSPWIDAMRGEVSTEGQPASVERVLVERGGERSFYDLMLYPLVDLQRQESVVRIEDVTERARTQELVVQTAKMISLGGLAAGMAHEINNPLGIISQATQNIERRLGPDLPANLSVAQGLGLDLELLRSYLEARSILAFVSSIQDAVGRASRIVANMLQFSRKPDGTRTPAALADRVERALELAANDYDLGKRFDFRSIAIHRDLEPDLPEVPMVATEIEQVVLNLLRNAAQAMADNPPERPPRLDIRIRRVSQHLVLEVEDNGPGMGDAVRRRIFEPFFTTKAPGLGTGLGLSVSYMIITQNHKGLFEVDSAPGQGARFSFRLPLPPGGPHA